ncbi:hypothetical protein ACWGH2_29230 [Streptomyces sp. NPDC054871]
MRPRTLYVLSAVFLPLVAICPPLASAVNFLLGLMFAGAGELLAQPAVVGAVVAGLIIASYRGRPRAAHPRST